MTDQNLGLLIGGSIAVATTLLNVGYNWLRYRSERQFSIRQQVYLEACEWAASGAEYLVSFARLDLDDAKLNEILRGRGAGAYKVHIVGDLSTVNAFTEAGTYLAIQSIDLLKRRVLLRNLMMRLENLRTEASQTSAYLQQTATVIDNIPKTAASQETLATIPTLVAEFTQARDRLLQTNLEINNLQDESLRLQEELLALGMRAAMDYQD